jgi:peptidoglycan/xylan/chitin deacetylase (PgdA/CDA1 family)
VTDAVPILAYHDVSPDPHPAFRRYSVTALEFERQMRWLAEAGYTALDLDSLREARQGGRSLPSRAVVITFDDGLRTCVEHAVPVLAECGLTAVFYLVADFVGTTSRWMREDPGVDLPLFGWDEAHELLEGGHQIGAHTASHPRLTALADDSCRAELAGARERLERELGTPVAHLAYPFGAWDLRVRELAAAAGYETACSTRPGLSPADDDLLALHRVTVYGHDSFADFRSRVRTGRSLGELFRRMLGGVASLILPGDR